MIKIEKKFTILKAVILDDEPKQVKTLKRILESDGFKVKIFDKQSEFKEYLENHIVQFLLFDVQLSINDKNIDGLKIAEQSAEKFGEAIKICISRKNVVDLNNEAIIKSINPIANKSYERYIEAYGDKHKPNEIWELVRYLRGKKVNNDDIDIYVDDSMSALIEDDFKFLNYRNNVTEPTRQFFELLKRLGSKPYEAEISKIHFYRIGTGRSRTIVGAMNVFIENDLIPFNSIIKIGYPDSISQEVNNYRRNVPKLIYHGHYPILESFSVCREFAGLAYGKLGAFEEKMVPPTLRDKIIFKEVDIKNNAKVLIEGIFKSIIFKQKTEEPAPIKTLRQGYTERYRTLNLVDELNQIVEQSLSKIEEFKFGRFNHPKKDKFKLSKFGNKEVRMLKDLMEGDVGFSSYRQKVCHGDLHFDNIITDQNSLQYYFIDFAHTQEHHCFLDHIVLELGVRFQLMNDYLLNSKDLKELIKELIKFEIKLNDIVLKTRNNTVIDSELIPFYNLICAIRHNASIQFPEESSCNYFGGLGLTFASALRLPIKEDIKEKLRLWFSVISLLSLEIFEDFVEKTETLNLTQYGSTFSISEEENILSQLDLFQDSIIHEVKSMIQGLRLSNKLKDEVYVKIIEKQQEEINSLMSLIKNEYPAFKNEIEKLNSLILEHISDPQITGGVSFGLPFLMLQVNKKIKLPEKLNTRIEDIMK